MRHGSTFDLFVQGLNITNAAMQANRDSLLLKPMLAACAIELSDEDFGVAIYGEDPDELEDSFTIRLQGHSFVLVSHRPPEAGEPAWKVSREYLQDVVDHPRKYVDSPSLLAFDWLKQRLNLTA